MKKALLLLLVCIWGVNLSARKELCLDAVLGDPVNMDTFEDIVMIPVHILITTGYSTIFGPTTATFNDCSVMGGALNKEEKERLLFLALNRKVLRGELPRRRGEFSEVVLTAFGCDDSREEFFDRINKNHTKIFREKEYGLSYAVRINRLLNKTGACDKNGFRRYISALDREFTARYPAFPRLPEKTSGPGYP